MKKILFALGIVCLCSCNTLQKEDAAVSDSTVAVSEEAKEVGVCSVDVVCQYQTYINFTKLDSILIKDANDSIVGVGYYGGNYSVPHNGTMTIYWKNKEYNKWLRNKYKLKVGIANHLVVEVYTEAIYVGDILVYEK